MISVPDHSTWKRYPYNNVSVCACVHTVQLHEVGAVIVDQGEQRCAVTHVPHQVLQQGEVGQLAPRALLPAVPHLATGGTQRDASEQDSQNTRKLGEGEGGGDFSQEVQRWQCTQIEKH